MATVVTMVMMVVGAQELQPSRADHHRDQRNRVAAFSRGHEHNKGSPVSRRNGQGLDGVSSRRVALILGLNFDRVQRADWVEWAGQRLWTKTRQRDHGMGIQRGS